MYTGWDKNGFAVVSMRNTVFILGLLTVNLLLPHPVFSDSDNTKLLKGDDGEDWRPRRGRQLIFIKCLLCAGHYVGRSTAW